MKERPILFSGPMVRAILAGRKTQTRRIVMCPTHKRPPDERPIGATFKGDRDPIWRFDCHFPKSMVSATGLCPYGVPGDHLWVRETWWNSAAPKDWPGSVVYRADTPGLTELGGKPVAWKPSIHIPRRYSRILLKVTRIRVQQLQEISERDAADEGAERALEVLTGKKGRTRAGLSFRRGYQELWDSINAKRGLGWQKNPWVWVVDFKRIG